MKIKRILPMILALALLLFAGCTDPGQSTGPDGEEPGITDPDENPDDGKDPDDGVQTVTLEGVVADVFGTALSVLCLGEGIPDWRTPAALALVCLGIWVVNRKPAEQGKA